MVGAEQWAELRREHFVAGKSIKELVRSTGLSRNTIRRALRSERLPSYRRAPKPRVLDPFKDEIHRLLREDPKLSGVRVRELLAPLGCMAGKTVVDDYLREVRPLFARPARTFQRTVYRPGEIVQFDVWRPGREVPVGHGQTRRWWVVIACLGYSRAGAGVLVFSTQTEDLLAGVVGCLQRLGGVPQTLVWDRQPDIHGHAGRPSDTFAARLRAAWSSPASVDTSRLGRFLFHLDGCGRLEPRGREHPARRVQPDGVVERFYVVEDGAAGVGLGRPRLPVDRPSTCSRCSATQRSRRASRSFRSPARSCWPPERSRRW